MYVCMHSVCSARGIFFAESKELRRTFFYFVLSVTSFVTLDPCAKIEVVFIVRNLEIAGYFVLCCNLLTVIVSHASGLILKRYLAISFLDWFFLICLVLDLRKSCETCLIYFFFITCFYRLVIVLVVVRENRKIREKVIWYWQFLIIRIIFKFRLYYDEHLRDSIETVEIRRTGSIYEHGYNLQLFDEIQRFASGQFEISKLRSLYGIYE